jgi:small-conductance mechanosensitive channel
MTRNSSPGGSGSRIFGGARLAFFVILLAALAVCIVFSWLTRGAMTDLAYQRAQAGQSLVSLRPWQTAQLLASGAVTAEEHQYARQAEALADHEVDQSFAAALRSAELQESHQPLTGPALVLSRKVAQIQSEVVQDQALVQRLNRKSAPALRTVRGAAGSAVGSDALQLAEARLALDSDELTDVKNALDRVTSSLSVRLQQELSAHEAAMKKVDLQQSGGSPIAIVSVQSHSTLVDRLRAWFSQISRYNAIQQAGAEGLNDARTLSAQSNALQAKAGPAAASATLAALEVRSVQRQILSIDEDRIQTDQQLASVYASWGDQVLLQHRLVAHLVLRSLEIVLFILLGMILGDAIVRRLMARPSRDRRQMHTLRTIFEVGVQLLGLFLIVLVLFGPPHQTTTMVGLVTAALTLSLQDYILAFFGWFMLVGRNGLHVGDMVEINGVSGEVVDVGLLSTTLLETTGLADKGEPTGRRVSFVNSFAIRGQYFNFSGEGQWMWDEITVSLPTDANLYAIAKEIERAAREETAESARLAEQEWNRGTHTAGLARFSGAPIVTMRPSVPAIDIATGVDLQVRYVTRAVGRYEVRDRLYRHVIQLLQEKKQPGPPEPPSAEPDELHTASV